MVSVYYVPKKPISIPLFNNETQSYTVYFEDSEVDIPADLFFKLFQRKEDEHEEKVFFKKDEPKPTIAEFVKANYTEEEIKKETNSIRERMAQQIRLAKMFGFTKETFISNIVNDPVAREKMGDKPLFDYMISITEEIWNEVERH